jgi:hypothetical protein
VLALNLSIERGLDHIHALLLAGAGDGVMHIVCCGALKVGIGEFRLPMLIYCLERLPDSSCIALSRALVFVACALHTPEQSATLADLAAASGVGAAAARGRVRDLKRAGHLAIARERRVP